MKRVNLADAFSRALPAHALEYEQYVAKLRSTILRAENVSSILADLLRRIGQLGNADSTRWRLAGKARPIQDPHAVSLWLRQHIRNLVSPLPTHKEKVAP